MENRALLLILLPFLIVSSAYAFLQLPSNANFPSLQGEKLIRELNLYPKEPINIVSEDPLELNSSASGIVERRLEWLADSSVSVEDLGHHAGYFKIQHSHAAKETIGSVDYAVREGEPDCSYYIRTGLCRYGVTCRFNHPPKENLAIAARKRGEYPERIGQLECQGEPLCIFYSRYGICKFGPSCKFDHPMG